jgi:sulfite reductase (NADPH) hemoprotein beta-component
VTLGGAADEKTAIGDIVGRAFTEDEVVDAIETIVTTYIGVRQNGERFIDTYRRVGIDPFKESLYETH